jgi:hypothetical protein
MAEVQQLQDANCCLSPTLPKGLTRADVT